MTFEVPKDLKTTAGFQLLSPNTSSYSYTWCWFIGSPNSYGFKSNLWKQAIKALSTGHAQDQSKHMKSRSNSLEIKNSCQRSPGQHTHTRKHVIFPISQWFWNVLGVISLPHIPNCYRIIRIIIEISRAKSSCPFHQPALTRWWKPSANHLRCFNSVWSELGVPFAGFLSHPF